MAKIDFRDIEIDVSDMFDLDAEGWTAMTGEDLVRAVFRAGAEIEVGGTDEIEIFNPMTGQTGIVDIEVDRSGIVRFALRARCECRNPFELCHPDA